VKLFETMRRLPSPRYVVPACLCASALFAQATLPPVTLKVEIANPKAGENRASAKDSADSSNVVVWLTPIGVGAAHSTPPAGPMPQIAQMHKDFDPHILVIQVGTAVQFPNRDPVLHNVFSLFDGKRFDLGFYEAGSSKTVHFDRPGVSFLFCNIHPDMSAAVVAVDTPYFGISDREGRVSVRNVPEGRYQLNVWYQRSLPADLKSASRVVTISEAARSLEPIRVIENPNFSLEHKNKYGQDYVPPANTSPSYKHP
jgi:plastocyanin